ncbi:unnamed protein product, partial [Ixodes hexagonus]
AAGEPCSGGNYQKLKEQCVKTMQGNIKATRGSLINNCRRVIIRNFAVCLQDSWKISRCENATSLLLYNDTLVADIGKRYFSNCFNDTRRFAQECRPEKAVQKLLYCGSQFYDTSAHVSDKRSSITLSGLCPQVEKYTLCAHQSQQDANCSSGLEMVPHIKYIMESIISRYQILCTALGRTAYQKGTTACNRQRFINDMFLCGYHFANIAEVVGGDNICKYLQKYAQCHNTSVETYGCAPPDQLYADARVFYSALTKRFAAGCPEHGIATNAPAVSRLTLREEFSCDGNRFIRYFFQCATGFVNATRHSPEDKEYICRQVENQRTW